MPKPNEYRAIFLGDVHMSNALPHARANSTGITDRLVDQQNMWGQLQAYRIEAGIRDVWILGDLFDRARVDAASLKATVEALTGIVRDGGRVRVLPGNHDTDDPTGSRFHVDAFDAMQMEGLWCVGKMDPVVVDDWLAFWPMAYAPVARNREHLEERRQSVDKYPHNVLLMHNSVVGAKHLGWTCDSGLDPAEVCAGYDAVISGHFHTMQTFGSCGRYLGAPMQFNFGDAGERRGFWDARFSRESASAPLDIEWHLERARVPLFHVVQWDELLEDGAEAIGDATEGDYMRIVVKATAAEFEGLRSGLDLHTEDLEAQGFKVSVQHEVVYHHKTRLGTTGAGAKLAAPPELISDYANRIGVAGELDKEELIAVGLELHEEATR